MGNDSLQDESFPAMGNKERIEDDSGVILFPTMGNRETIMSWRLMMNLSCIDDSNKTIISLRLMGNLFCVDDRPQRSASTIIMGNITFCKALKFMTVFSTEMTEIISGFDAKMTKMTQSVIKLKLNNTRYYQASIGQPCYQSCETASNDTGMPYVSH